MPRPTDERARVLGPYWNKSKQRWRLIVIHTPAAAREKDRSSTFHYPSEEEALDAKRDLEDRICNVTIEAAILAYEQHLAEKGTIGYAETVRRLKLFFPNHEMLIGRITAEKGRKWYDAFRQRKRPDGEPISVSYHRTALTNARSMLSWCVEEHRWLPSNPFASVKGVGKSESGKSQHNGDEARKFYAFVLARARAGDTTSLAVLMVLLMALRASDITRRDVRDVDLDGTVLNVTKGKTRKSNRPREIPEVLQPLVRKLVRKRSPFEPLFPSEQSADGRHVAHWLWQAMERLCRQAGVPRVCTHALKGTAGTLAARAGAQANVVADYLSHEDEGATARRHYVDAGELEAAQAKQGLKVIAGGKR